MYAIDVNNNRFLIIFNTLEPIWKSDLHCPPDSTTSETASYALYLQPILESTINVKWHNLSTWNSYCGSKYVLTSWWGRPCLQFDGNLQPTIDYRRSSSHSPECQFPLNQIYLVVTDVEILLLLDTYKIFFEVMASCCLQGNIEANQSSVPWPMSENWINL